MVDRRASLIRKQPANFNLSLYPQSPGSKSTPQLHLDTSDLQGIDKLQRTSSRTFTIKQFSNNLFNSLNPLKPNNSSPVEDVSPITLETRLASMDRLGRDDFGSGPMIQPGAPPVRPAKRGFFGSSKAEPIPTGQTMPHHHPEQYRQQHSHPYPHPPQQHRLVHKTGEEFGFGMEDDTDVDKHFDEASIFTTDLKRTPTTRVAHSSEPIHPHTKHPAPATASTQSTGSRIANFFGANRDKSSHGKSSRRPATSDGTRPTPAMQVKVESEENSKFTDEMHESSYSKNGGLDKGSTPAIEITSVTREFGLMPTVQGERLRTASTTNGNLRAGAATQPLHPSHVANTFGSQGQGRGLVGFNGQIAQHARPSTGPIALGGQDYPKTRMERNFRFTWEYNPGVTDGRMVMGFGGEFGRKRVKLESIAGNGRAPVRGDHRGAAEVRKLPYVLGYERSVVDCEAMINEAYTAAAGGKATFFPENMPSPRRVLDLGTGIGQWAIAMAQEWPESTFVGYDIAPIQTDLQALARAQAYLSQLQADGESTEKTDMVNWQDLARRITWRIGNFLDNLPFETGYFDMVHLRFVGLGIPESAWDALLDEASRVLKRDTGVLEIVEMSKALPTATPIALRASFSSLMLSSMIQPHPFVTLRAAIASSGLRHKEVMNKTLKRNAGIKGNPTDIIENCLSAWVDSALGKGKHGRGRGMSGSGGASSGWGEQALGELAHKQLESPDDGPANFGRVIEAPDEKPDSMLESDGITVVAWIIRR